MQSPTASTNLNVYSIYLNGIKLSKVLVLYTQLLLNILNYKQLPVLLLEVALYKYVIE